MPRMPLRRKGLIGAFGHSAFPPSAKASRLAVAALASSVIPTTGNLCLSSGAERHAMFVISSCGSSVMRSNLSVEFQASSSGRGDGECHGTKQRRGPKGPDGVNLDEAFAGLRPAMFFPAYRITGKPRRRREIVQDAFVRLYNAAPKGSGTVASKSYLATITARTQPQSAARSTSAPAKPISASGCPNLS